MKHYLISLIFGLLASVAIFVVPSVATGLYGFIWHEQILSVFPLAEWNLMLLGIPYAIVALPLIMVYLAAIFYRKGQAEITTATLFYSLLFFGIGFYVVFLLYLFLGLIAFSRGSFIL